MSEQFSSGMKNTKLTKKERTRMHINSNSYGYIQNAHIRIKQHLSLGGLFIQNRTFISSKDLPDRFIRLTLHLKKNEI